MHERTVFATSPRPTRRQCASDAARTARASPASTAGGTIALSHASASAARRRASRPPASTSRRGCVADPAGRTSNRRNRRCGDISARIHRAPTVRAWRVRNARREPYPSASARRDRIPAASATTLARGVPHAFCAPSLALDAACASRRNTHRASTAGQAAARCPRASIAVSSLHAAAEAAAAAPPTSCAAACSSYSSWSSSSSSFSSSRVLRPRASGSGSATHRQRRRAIFSRKIPGWSLGSNTASTRAMSRPAARRTAPEPSSNSATSAPAKGG